MFNLSTNIFKCLFLTFILCSLVGLIACKKATPSNQDGSESLAYGEAPTEDEISPEDQKLIAIGKPLAEALASKQYDKFYNLLHPKAKEKMKLNQFLAPMTDQEYLDGDKAVYENVSLEQFIELMGKVDALYGDPVKLDHLYVSEKDPEVLSGKNQNMEEAFSIGMIHDSIAPSTRKASLRGQIITRLTQKQIEEEANRLGVSVDEFIKTSAEEGSQTVNWYYSIKMVLIEDQGALHVGYFEFARPSMFD